MTTMSIQLPARSEKIGKFVSSRKKCYRLSPITFDYVEKFYTNENGCVDFDKFETVQELVNYMIGHPRITNYWHTTDELKKLDEIRYWLGNKIRVFSPVYQNGIIISDSSYAGYMEIKDTIFGITLDSTMYDVMEFIQYYRSQSTFVEDITEDDDKYTIRDLIRIYHNNVYLYDENIYNGAKLREQEMLNQQDEMQQDEEMQQEEFDSVPWYLQAPRPISTVFGQSTITRSFM